MNEQVAVNAETAIELVTPKNKFKTMIEELSDYSFCKLRGWLAHNFTDVLCEFDENIIEGEEDEYLEKFRNYIDNLECDYKIQEKILKTEVDQIAELFDFKSNETYTIILDSIETTAIALNELFIIENLITGERKYLEIGEEIQNDIEILEKFINDIQSLNRA